MTDSHKYGYIIFGGLTANISYNLRASILRALGDSKTPFYAIVVSTMLNIILDLLCVFVFKTGVEGPVAVIVFAQTASALFCFSRLRKIELIHLSLDDFMHNAEMILKLLKNSIPMAVMNSITAVGCMTVQYFVNGMGVVYTSAYSACSKYINLFMQPACTAGYTMSSFTSQNYGAKKYDRIIIGLKVCLFIAAVSYVVLGSVMIIFPQLLASLILIRCTRSERCCFHILHTKENAYKKSTDNWCCFNIKEVPQWIISIFTVLQNLYSEMTEKTKLENMLRSSAVQECLFTLAQVQRYVQDCWTK